MPTVRQPASNSFAKLGFETLEDRATPAAGFFNQAFGTNGISLTSFVRNTSNNLGSTANAVAVQPDGKIIMVGAADSPILTGGTDMAVVRLTPDGILDPTFGSGGRVLIPFDLGGFGFYYYNGYNNVDVATAVVVTSGGGIIVGGNVSTNVNQGDFGLAKLTSSGALDTSFGSGGKVTLDFTSGGRFPYSYDDTVSGLAIQPDGKIVAVGNSQNRGFAVARFNANGILDGSFNMTGQAVITGAFRTPFYNATNANAVAVQADGNIVVVGDISGGFFSNSGSDMGVVRLKPDGTLDTTFATGGRFTAGFANTGGRGSAKAVKIDSAGSIVVAGSGRTNLSNGADFAVIKLTKNGAYDTSFSGGKVVLGIDLFPTNSDDVATGVVVQSNGSIVVAGNANDPFGNGFFYNGSVFAAARIGANGQIDTSFGNNGKNTFNVGNYNAFYYQQISTNGLALRPDGSYLIVGTNGFDMTAIGVTGDGGGGGGGGGFSSLFNSVIAASTDDGQIAAYGVSTPGAYNTDIVVRLSSATVFNGYVGLVRTAVADVNGDTIPDFIMVTGPGTPTMAAVVSGADQLTYIVQPFYPFRGSEKFTGGGYVSVGDLTGDGVADFIITPDQGGGPRVVVFSAVNGLTLKADFFGVSDAGFRGGAQTAVGDVNGDGTLDLAVAAGAGGGPRAAVFDGLTMFTTRTKLVSDFFALPNVLRNGVSIAIGDVDGDGFADLVIGAGDGGASQVLILSGKLLMQNGAAAAAQAPIDSFFVNGDSSARVGVRVSVRNVDGDKYADVVVGSGPGQASRMRVYLGQLLAGGGGEPGTFQDLDPFSTTPTNGVFVG